MRYPTSMILAATVVAGMAAAAQADDLLVVDLSVADQVTISATSGVSAVTITGSDSTGVYFENFFGGSGAFMADTLVSGDLTNFLNSADFSPDLFRAFDDSGLNIWSWSDDLTVNFTAGVQAFAGSATWTLSSDIYSDMLAGSRSGNLYFPADSADDVANAALLGTYSVVVPAPGAASLAGLGLIGALRRRRR